MKTKKNTQVGPVLYLGKVNEIDYFQVKSGYTTHFLMKDQTVIRPFYGLEPTSCTLKVDAEGQLTALEWQAIDQPQLMARIQALLDSKTPLFALVQWPEESWLQGLGLRGGVQLELSSTGRHRHTLRLAASEGSVSVPKSVLPHALGDKPKFRLSESVQTGAFDQLVALVPEADSPAPLSVIDEIWYGEEWVPLLGPVPNHPEQRLVLIPEGPTHPAKRLQFVCPAGGGYSMTAYERC